MVEQLDRLKLLNRKFKFESEFQLENITEKKCRFYVISENIQVEASYWLNMEIMGNYSMSS